MLNWKDLFIGKEISYKTSHYDTQLSRMVTLNHTGIIIDLCYTKRSYRGIGIKCLNSDGNVYPNKNMGFQYGFISYLAPIIGKNLYNHTILVPEVGDYINSFFTNKISKKRIAEIDPTYCLRIRFENEERFMTLRKDQFFIPYKEQLVVSCKEPLIIP